MGSGIKRRGVRKARHFVAYGGPENGSIVRIANGAVEYIADDGRRTHSAPFSYLLVDAPDRGSALVPMEDHDLRQAFFDAHAGGDQRALTVLDEELKRRGLRER
jgi:hypothetical protein